jgi:hypothetical protein
MMTAISPLSSTPLDITCFSMGMRFSVRSQLLTRLKAVPSWVSFPSSNRSPTDEWLRHGGAIRRTLVAFDPRVPQSQRAHAYDQAMAQLATDAAHAR